MKCSSMSLWRSYIIKIFVSQEETFQEEIFWRTSFNSKLSIDEKLFQLVNFEFNSKTRKFSARPFNILNPDIGAKYIACTVSVHIGVLFSWASKKGRTLALQRKLVLRLHMTNMISNDVGDKVFAQLPTSERKCHQLGKIFCTDQRYQVYSFCNTLSYKWCTGEDHLIQHYYRLLWRIR